MSQRNFRVGDHEYIITAVPLTAGGFTTTVVHLDHSGPQTIETRHDSNLMHPTEDEALGTGEATARYMAQRQAS